MLFKTDLPFAAANLATAFEFTHTTVILTKFVLAAGPAVHAAGFQTAFKTGAIGLAALLFKADLTLGATQFTTLFKVTHASVVLADLGFTAGAAIYAAGVRATFKSFATGLAAGIFKTDFRFRAAVSVAVDKIANAQVCGTLRQLAAFAALAFAFPFQPGIIDSPAVSTFLDASL